MVQVKALTDRSVAERFREVKDEEGFWGDVAVETRQLVKRIVESALDEELAAREARAMSCSRLSRAAPRRQQVQ